MEQGSKLGLSLEQEFQLKAFEERIKHISLEQSKILLTELYRKLLVREAYFKHVIKQRLLTDYPPN